MSMFENRGRGAVRIVAGMVLSVLFILPLYWALVASLQEPGAPPAATVSWWVANPHLENYAAVFSVVPMAKYLANSLVVVSFAVPLTLLTASTAGFALSQVSGANRNTLIQFSVALMLIPGAAIWLFRFQLLVWMGLLDTLWALILPAFAASNPLFVLLFYWNFRRVPAETFDAARLDGADVIAAWWRIALPLARPTLIGVSVLAFVLYWSDFISPVLYIYDPDAYTLPVGLQLLNQVGSTNWPVLMAGAVLMTAPVLLFFLLIQRFFLHDLSLADLFDRSD